MIEIVETKPWERQPGEPNLWFGRFEQFRMAGSRRTILGTFSAELAEAGKKKHYPGLSGSWSIQSDRWHWRARAEAWDDFERARKQREYEQEREEDRRTRIQLLRFYRAKLADALRSLNLDSELGGVRPSLNDLTAALKMTTSELRAEYDQEPKKRIVFGIEEWRNETERIAREMGIDPQELQDETQSLVERDA